MDEARTFSEGVFRPMIRDKLHVQPSIEYFDAPVIVDNVTSEIIADGGLRNRHLLAAPHIPRRSTASPRLSRRGVRLSPPYLPILYCLPHSPASIPLKTFRPGPKFLLTDTVH